VPTFIDRHAMADVDRDMRHQVHLEALNGLRDRNGTLPLAHWIDDQAVYCILEAPDAQAVCDHHHRRGMGCSDLHPIAGLSGRRPLTGADVARVRAAIARIWHISPPA
jgi:hypothetical protein